MIILATQGANGIAALRELYALGYKPDEITLLDCGEQFSLKDFSISVGQNVHAGKLTELPLEEYDLLLSISWKYKVPKEVIDSIDCINLHPGLLPNYKGCFSTVWSLLNNEEYVGYTYHFMDYSYDTGNIIHQKKILVKEKDTAFSLNHRIYQHAMTQLGSVLDKYKTVPRQGYYSNRLPTQEELNDEQMKQYKRAMYYPPYETEL